MSLSIIRSRGKGVERRLRRGTDGVSNLRFKQPESCSFAAGELARVVLPVPHHGPGDLIPSSNFRDNKPLCWTQRDLPVDQLFLTI
jgi:hypothetical protein